MRQSTWAPSISPDGTGQTVYLVVDDFGRHGRAWRETDIENTDLETVITDLLDGQYNSPVRVVGFSRANLSRASPACGELGRILVQTHCGQSLCGAPCLPLRPRGQPCSRSGICPQYVAACRIRPHGA